MISLPKHPEMAKLNQCLSPSQMLNYVTSYYLTTNCKLIVTTAGFFTGFFTINRIKTRTITIDSLFVPIIILSPCPFSEGTIITLVYLLNSNCISYNNFNINYAAFTGNPPLTINADLSKYYMAVIFPYNFIYSVQCPFPNIPLNAYTDNVVRIYIDGRLQRVRKYGNINFNIPMNYGKNYGNGPGFVFCESPSYCPALSKYMEYYSNYYIQYFIPNRATITLDSGLTLVPFNLQFASQTMKYNTSEIIILPTGNNVFMDNTAPIQALRCQ